MESPNHVSIGSRACAGDEAIARCGWVASLGDGGGTAELFNRSLGGPGASLRLRAPVCRGLNCFGGRRGEMVSPRGPGHLRGPVGRMVRGESARRLASINRLERRFRGFRGSFRVAGELHSPGRGANRVIPGIVVHTVTSEAMSAVKSLSEPSAPPVEQSRCSPAVSDLPTRRSAHAPPTSPPVPNGGGGAR